MQYGGYMGCLWIVKFYLIVYAFVSHSDAYMFFASLLFLVATCAVPFIAYFMGRNYRQTVCNDTLAYFPALRLTMLIYLFASILTAAGHYVYFVYLDEGRFMSAYLYYLEQSPLPAEMSDMAEQVKEMAAQATPKGTVMQMLSNNLLYGVIQSLIIAIFVAKKPKYA